MQFSHRLKALAAMIPKEARIADIGTDHAYLPIHLAMRGTHPTVIGTELSPGPFARAFSCVCEHGLEDRVELRLGDGLEIIQPGEIDVLVIAGMGGATMVEILTRGREHLSHLKRLVLQPMGGQEPLRHWLDDHGWHPVQEDLIKEEGKYYEIIAAEPGQDEAYANIRHRIGPRLMESPHPLLGEYLTYQKGHWENVLAQVKQSHSPVQEDRVRELEQRIHELEEVLSCLLTSVM